MDWFKLHETAAIGSQFDWNKIITQLKFNQHGLIPCITQQELTQQVLMMAWMNEEAITQTLTKGIVHYWSRSRQKLWKKGEQSGQTQHLIELRIDCDGDTLLAIVNQQGPACHTGRASCFFYSLEQSKLKINSQPIIKPTDLYPT